MAVKKKKPKRKTPAFPERDDLIAYCKLATKLSSAHKASVLDKLTPEVRKLVDAVIVQSLCNEGLDSAAEIIERATGAKGIRTVLELADDQDSSPGCGSVYRKADGGLEIGLGFNAGGNYEVINSAAQQIERSISGSAASEKEIDKLHDAQLKLLKAWMR